MLHSFNNTMVDLYIICRTRKLQNSKCRSCRWRFRPRIPVAFGSSRLHRVESLRHAPPAREGGSDSALPGHDVKDNGVVMRRARPSVPGCASLLTTDPGIPWEHRRHPVHDRLVLVVPVHVTRRLCKGRVGRQSGRPAPRGRPFRSRRAGTPHQRLTVHPARDRHHDVDDEVSFSVDHGVDLELQVGDPPVLEVRRGSPSTFGGPGLPPFRHARDQEPVVLGRDVHGRHHPDETSAVPRDACNARPVR